LSVSEAARPIIQSTQNRRAGLDEKEGAGRAFIQVQAKILTIDKSHYYAYISNILYP